MAFLVYSRHEENGKEILRATGNNFSLAGYNLIYSAWNKQGRPIKQGWQVTAGELISIYSDGKDNYDTLRLLIDYNPNSKERIGFIELLEIYLFTWDGASPDVPGWTPMMLKMRDVLDLWPDEPVNLENKKQLITTIVDPPYGNEFVEFLYLIGDSWNWGRNGATNAVFLHDEARSFFRKFF